MNQEPQVVWPVVEDHLEEAAFALQRFEAGLSSSTLTLNAVAAGSEWVLLANVAGLVVGGEAIVEKVLLPRLTAKKPPPAHRVATIVMTFLQGHRAPLAMRALTHEEPAVRRAAMRGCMLGAGSSLDLWIAQSLANPKSRVSRPVLLELACDRGLAVESLVRSLHADDPDELIAALRVAWRVPPAPIEGRLLTLLDHPHAGVRDAAMLTSLHHGSFQGWALCQQLAFDPAAPHPLAMVLVAGLGEPGHHKRLAAMVGSEVHHDAALRALGFAGSVGVAPLLLHHAQSKDKPTAALAKEALATTLGGDVDRLLVGKDGVAALAAWWESVHGRFNTGRRYLAGLQVSRGSFAHALTHFPTRRRYLISLLLSIRTGGASRVSTRALSATQRAQIFAVGSNGPEQPWVREFSAF
jgi:alkylhydroperoxidase family enzyme